MKKCQTNPVFYYCPICGNLVEMINSSGNKLICCGQEMKKLKAKTADEGLEKHVPVFTCEGGKVTVKVGSIAHPMTEEHHIMWIELITNKGIQRKCIYPKTEATTCFHISDTEKVLAVYEFCSLHGLWVQMSASSQQS